MKFCFFEFESLYSNIKLSDALYFINKYLINKKRYKNFDLIAFIQILTINGNFFFYFQI